MSVGQHAKSKGQFLASLIIEERFCLELILGDVQLFLDLGCILRFYRESDGAINEMRERSDDLFLRGRTTEQNLRSLFDLTFDIVVHRYGSNHRQKNSEYDSDS